MIDTMSAEGYRHGGTSGLATAGNMDRGFSQRATSILEKHDAFSDYNDTGGVLSDIRVESLGIADIAK